MAFYIKKGFRHTDGYSVSDVAGGEYVTPCITVHREDGSPLTPPEYSIVAIRRGDEWMHPDDSEFARDESWLNTMIEKAWSGQDVVDVKTGIRFDPAVLLANHFTSIHALAQLRSSDYEARRLADEVMARA